MSKQITFDEENHIYYVEGFITPSVNEINNEVYGSGLENAPAFFVERAAAVGKKVHKQIEDFIHFKKTTTLSTKDYFVDKCSELLPQTAQFIEFSDKHLDLALYSVSEQIVFAETPYGNYCGTADLFCNGWLIDYKTSKTASKGQIEHWQRQLSFYYYALKQQGKHLLGMKVLHLTANNCEEITLDYLGDDFVLETMKAYQAGKSLKKEKEQPSSELQTVSQEELVKFASTVKQIKFYKELIKSVEDKIKAEMEARNILSLNIGDVLISYTAPTKRRDFNKAKFKAEHGDLYDAYITETPVSSSIKIKVKNNG